MRGRTRTPVTENAATGNHQKDKFIVLIGLYIAGKYMPAACSHGAYPSYIRATSRARLAGWPALLTVRTYCQNNEVQAEATRCIVSCCRRDYSTAAAAAVLVSGERCSHQPSSSNYCRLYIYVCVVCVSVVCWSSSNPQAMHVPVPTQNTYENLSFHPSTSGTPSSTYAEAHRTCPCTSPCERTNVGPFR